MALVHYRIFHSLLLAPLPLSWFGLLCSAILSGFCLVLRSVVRLYGCTVAFWLVWFVRVGSARVRFLVLGLDKVCPLGSSGSVVWYLAWVLVRFSFEIWIYYIVPVDYCYDCSPLVWYNLGKIVQRSRCQLLFYVG